MTEPRRFAVVDDAGLVDNVILYDPDDEYDPGDGLALVELADDSRVGVGDVIDHKTGDVLEAAEPAPVERGERVQLAVDALVAKLVERKLLTAADAEQLDAATATNDAEAKP